MVRTLHEQDHYEVLEVARGAAPEEIERAYRVARDTYDPDSLALYSVFGARDAQLIRERIEEAYRVLSDWHARRAYDVTVLVKGGDEVAPAEGEPVVVDAAEATGPGGLADGLSDTFRDIETDAEEEGGDFDGAKLRRARLRRGFELDHIADITKVSIRILRQIEEDDFDDLPAIVYVRGFLSAYARTIGLDPARVVSSYLPRVERSRAGQGRGVFRGRR